MEEEDMWVALTLLCFVLGAMALGALLPTFSATLLVAAAYTCAILARASINDWLGSDGIALLLLGLVMFIIAGASGLIGHNAMGRLRGHVRSSRRRYTYE
jgi:hypothetical protein